MNDNKIDAHKITKPIQLLAAWLVGLSIINITFLAAASKLSNPSWIPASLVIASIVNVPLFIGSIFLLQTKYRPEMQEDSYYSEYLGKKSTKIEKSDFNEQLITDKLELLSTKISNLAKDNPINFSEKVKELISDERIDELSDLFGDRRSLSELYIRPQKWPEIVGRWEDSEGFKSDIAKLTISGLVVMNGDSLSSLSLTELGKKVAKRTEEKNKLFAQKKAFIWERENSEKEI